MLGQGTFVLSFASTLLVGGKPPQPAGASHAGWPTPRFGHALIFHADTGTTVLFGREATVEARTHLGDTRVWNGTHWSRMARTGAFPRMDVAVVYDAVRDRIVLFGGNGPPGATPTDTWQWDGTQWERRASGRAAHAPRERSAA
jgi:hypothetical protein